MVVLNGGLVSDDLSKEVHLSVLLRELESLVDAVREDEELDGGIEVAKFEKKSEIL